MSVFRVNGLQLLGMLKNGLGYLASQAEYINDLNVFPVADGDTGTNMTKTLESGIRNAVETAHVGQLLKRISEGMLFGARGNSGVILSQFFRGMYIELSRQELLGPGELRNGLLAGYKMAYQAVARPVEGTMLTVARQGIENIRGQITRRTHVDIILSMYIAEMKKALTFTPELLPVLKESGVVDSGAYGFVCIFEGMLKYLFGETVAHTEVLTEKQPAHEDASCFDAQSEFTEGYCFEFILQLLKTGKYNQHFEINKFIADLQLFGSSIVAVQDGTVVKVHIHTLYLARVISLCEEYGAFVDVKVDNLQMQKNAQEQKRAGTQAPKASAKERIPFGKIAVADGEGYHSLFRELGCDMVLDERADDSISTQDFYSAAASLNAAQVLLLPDNKNAVMSAEQAKKMLAEQGIAVTVIPTANPVEGYFALALDIPDLENTDTRIEKMRQYQDGLNVIEVTEAQKQGCFDGVACEIGDTIALLDGRIVCADKHRDACVVTAIQAVEDLADKDSVVIFYGKDVAEAEREALEALLGSTFPCLEIETLEGGQDVYRLRIGLV